MLRQTIVPPWYWKAMWPGSVVMVHLGDKGPYTADQHLFERTVAEPVDDALDSLRRDPTAIFGRLVNVGSSIDGMRGVALFLQPAQHRPHRRFLQWTRQPPAHGLGRHRAVGPNQLHHLAFELSELRQAVGHDVTLRCAASCNATKRRIRRAAPQ